MQYEWVEGSQFSSKQYDPNVVASYLVEHHIDTAEKFVTDAEKRSSPLHSFIDWNDTTAAQEYRFVQARKVIRSLRVIYTKPNGKNYSVKAFTHLPSQHAYMHVVRLKSSSVLRDEAIKEALLDVQAFVRRFEQYKELVRIGHHAQVQITKLLKKKKKVA